MSLLSLLIISSKAINNDVIYLEVVALCSSTQTDPFVKFATTFAKYIVYIKDVFLHNWFAWNVMFLVRNSMRRIIDKKWTLPNTSPLKISSRCQQQGYILLIAYITINFIEGYEWRIREVVWLRLQHPIIVIDICLPSRSILIGTTFLSISLRRTIHNTLHAIKLRPCRNNIVRLLFRQSLLHMVFGLQLLNFILDMSLQPLNFFRYFSLVLLTHMSLIVFLPKIFDCSNVTSHHTSRWCSQ